MSLTPRKFSAVIKVGFAGGRHASRSCRGEVFADGAAFLAQVRDLPPLRRRHGVARMRVEGGCVIATQVDEQHRAENVKVRFTLLSGGNPRVALWCSVSFSKHHA